MSSRRVLLTGAAGFIGRAVIAPLLDLSYEVHAVGNAITDDRARWYRADLLDQHSRQRLVAAVRPHAVLHCAWATQVGSFWTARENLDWVAASLELGRSAVEHGAERMLMVGSCAEYDWHVATGRPWQEADACRPTSLYGTAKDSLRRLMEVFAAQAGIGLVWARLFNIYGPHDSPERLVTGLMTALRAGRRAETGPGNVTRDFLHVTDVGRALAHLLASDTSGPVNVASGQPVTVGSIANHIGRLAGRPELIAIGVREAVGPEWIVADTTRLRSSGFVPSITLADGMASLWANTDGSALPVSKPAPAPDYDEAARLYRQGRYDAARSAAEAVLAKDANNPAALNLVGVLHRQSADPLRALHYLQRAAELDPEHETAWVNLGNVQLDLEAADAAVDAYTRALNAAPQRTDTLRLLGNALARAERDDEAIARFDQALARSPGNVTTLRDRARAHFMAGRTDAALADLDAALATRPDDLDLPLIKTQMLRLSGYAKDASAVLHDLLARAPDNAGVHLALADALLADEDRAAANEHYRRAVALSPADTLAQGKLCWSLLNSRYGNEAAHIAEAVGVARQLVARGSMHPANAHAVQSALLRIADHETLAAFDALFPDRRALLDYWVHRNVLGALHGQLGRVQSMDERLELMACHRRWGERYEAKTTPLRPRGASPGSRIRVGFVSSDLRHHPVTYFAQPIFEHYDRQKFEFFAYSFFPGRADAIQKQIAKQVAAFRQLPNLPEQEIAQRIADDGLDILFELGGSTHLNRLEVLAHQPAPVQVSWLGYPHSSGLSRIGYILVDPYLRPRDPRLLLERPFEMPSSWVSLGRLGFADQPILPGIPEERAGRLTFGTMNNPYKYSPEAIALWARVLREVPGSRFMMVRPEAGTAVFREAMARAFARHGIASDRLAFVPVRGRHMAHYNDIDIALDTLPQTGGTTTCECLWMGVPTVSLVGPAFFERLSFSNLTNAGLGDLAVDSADAYVEAALGLVADVSRRRALRQELRDAIRISPLGDTERWVRDFQALIVQTLEVGPRVKPGDSRTSKLAALAKKF
jgi:protein O-GlcNAc transferase